MRTFVLIALAVSLLLGTHALSFEEKKPPQEAFDFAYAPPSAQENQVHHGFCYIESIGILVLVGVQGYLQYQRFMNHCSK